MNPQYVVQVIGRKHNILDILIVVRPKACPAGFDTGTLLVPRRMGLLHPTGFLASPEKEGLFFSTDGHQENEPGMRNREIPYHSLQDD